MLSSTDNPFDTMQFNAQALLHDERGEVPKPLDAKTAEHLMNEMVEEQAGLDGGSYLLGAKTLTDAGCNMKRWNESGFDTLTTGGRTSFVIPDEFARAALIPQLEDWAGKKFHQSRAEADAANVARARR